GAAVEPERLEHAIEIVDSARVVAIDPHLGVALPHLELDRSDVKTHCAAVRRIVGAGSVTVVVRTVRTPRPRRVVEVAEAERPVAPGIVVAGVIRRIPIWVGPHDGCPGWRWCLRSRYRPLSGTRARP